MAKKKIRIKVKGGYDIINVDEIRNVRSVENYEKGEPINEITMFHGSKHSTYDTADELWGKIENNSGSGFTNMVAAAALALSLLNIVNGCM